MNQELQKQLAQILGAMQDAVRTYGPDALNLALNVRRFEGAGQLLAGLAQVLIPLLLLSWVWRRFGRAPKQTPETQARIDYLRERGYGRRSTAEDNELGWLTGGLTGWLIAGPQVMLAVLALTATLPFIFDGVSALVNIWNWVALAHPEVALAHDLWVKVVSP